MRLVISSESWHIRGGAATEEGGGYTLIWSTKELLHAVVEERSACDSDRLRSNQAKSNMLEKWAGGDAGFGENAINAT